MEASTPWDEYRRFFEVVRELGCQVALKHFAEARGDDLRLLAMQPDYVKLSLQNVPQPGSAASTEHLDTIVRYAQSQGTKVVMESIETCEHLRQALKFRPDYLQGYFIGHPRVCVDTVSLEVREALQELQP